MRFSDGFWLQSSISVVYCHSTAAIIPHIHEHVDCRKSFCLVRTDARTVYAQVNFIISVFKLSLHFTHNNDDAYFPSTDEQRKGIEIERKRDEQGPQTVCVRENYFLCFDIRRHTLLRTFYWNNDENLLNWLHQIKYTYHSFALCTQSNVMV